MIDGKLVNGDIAGQVLLVNPTKRTQEITQAGPAAFVGVDMNLPNAIAIVITRPFIFTVTDRVADPLEFVVTIVLIGVDCGLSSGELFNERTQGRSFGIFHNPDANLTRRPADNRTNWGTVIGISASSRSFIGPFARRV